MIALRIVTALACGVDLGLMVLLFQQVGRFFIPRWQMRGLMVTVMVIVATLGVANLQHVHRPPTLFTWALAIGIVGKAAILLSLVHWYGSTAGHRHVTAILASRDAAAAGPELTPLERRVDRLVIAVLIVGGGIIFNLLVIGVSNARTHHDEARTHTALCTFRADLGAREKAAAAAYATSHDYVFGNPRKHLPAHHGPILGFPRKTVIASLRQQATMIQNQQRTYDSLAGLHC